MQWDYFLKRNLERLFRLLVITVIIPAGISAPSAGQWGRRKLGRDNIKQLEEMGCDTLKQRISETGRHCDELKTPLKYHNHGNHTHVSAQTHLWRKDSLLTLCFSL